MSAAGTTDIVGYGKPSVRARVGRPLAYVFLFLLLAITILPFVWVMLSAFSTNNALFAGEFEFTWLNFKRVLGFASEEEILFASGRENTAELNFLTALRNSVIIATTISIGQVFFSAMAAYAFARLKFKGRDKIFLVYLSGMMIPPIITLIPNAIFVRELGWSASLVAIIAPFFLMTPFSVFFMRQFFLSVNRSIEEAALIDGAGTVPGLLVDQPANGQTPNDHAWCVDLCDGMERVLVALHGCSEERSRSAPHGGSCVNSTYRPPEIDRTGLGLLAATTIATLPVIIIFLVFGRRIVDSIRFTGVK